MKIKIAKICESFYLLHLSSKVSLMESILLILTAPSNFHMFRTTEQISCGLKNRAVEDFSNTDLKVSPVVSTW